MHSPKAPCPAFVAPSSPRQPTKPHAARAGPRKSGKSPLQRLRQPSPFRRCRRASKARCRPRLCRGPLLTVLAAPDRMAPDCLEQSAGSAACPEPAGSAVRHRIASPWMRAISAADEAGSAPTIQDRARLPSADLVYVVAGTCDLCILTRDFEENSSCRAINCGFCVAHGSAPHLWRPLTPGLRP